MRKIRTKPKKQEVEDVSGVAIPSKVGKVQIALKALKAGETLSKNDIEVLTDYGAVADSVAKEMAADVKAIKAGILEYAKRTKTKKFAGRKGSFSIGASSKTTYGTAMDLVKILKKHGKIKLFDDMVSVKITEAKKYLGEHILETEGFIKKDSEPYGKVGLKVLS